MRSAIGILAVLAAAPAPARELPRVEGTELGPPMESVTAIFEDRRGFLWIGSREGLALYDGYTAVVFEHVVSDPGSISDNNIRAVFEDSKGTIWVGTNTGGLERLDRSEGAFRHYRRDSADPASLPHDSVYAIVEAPDGTYWVGTQGGLARFDAATGAFERVPAGPSGPGSDYIVQLRVEVDGTLWVATATGGLSRRDPATGAFRSYRHDPADPSSLPGNGVYTIDEDGEGRLWLSTEAGACRFDPGTGTCRTFPFEGWSRSSPPLVTSVSVGVDGEIWAATLDAGLWRLDGERFLRHPFRTARSTDSSSRIVATLADREGNLWLGTWSEGLGRVSPRSRVFAAAPGDALAGEISALRVDGSDRLWVGSLGGGIEAFAPGESVRRYRGTAIPLSILATNDAVWFGATDGLRRLDPATGEETLYRNDPADPRSLGAGWVWAVHADRDGRLWVGTGTGGLDRLEDDETFTRFLHDASDPGSLSDDYVTAIAEDGSGSLWVGTRSGGLDALDPATGRFRRFVPDPDDPRSLSHHSVSAILVDASGRLWIGTAGGGLDLALRDGGGSISGFDRFTETDGLISNNVVSLLEDDDGTIWVGTRRGLSRLDPGTRRFVNYGAEDGLASAEMTPGAASAGRGVLWFGTHRGVAAVRRGTPFPRNRPSPTVVTAVRTIGGDEPTERPAPREASVVIPWGRILSLEFAVLDYGDRRRHRYAYRIGGGHDDWVDLGARREITFTDLEPGKYEIRVRGRDDQGTWSETDPPVRVTVVPPFWMTSWFRALCGLLAAGLVIGVHKGRTAALSRRNRELEDLKDQRERALEEARRSEVALQGAYERLRGLTRRLEAAKEDERKRIARELHDEMGQALTTAKLNLQLVSESAGPADRDRRIADALDLLDLMIGHVRALSLDLRPPLLDELGLAAALRGYVEALGKRSGLEVDLRVPALPHGIPTEVEIAAFRVVQESLTNVLRHADSPRAEVEVRYDPGALHLTVSDGGRGFDVTAVLERAGVGEHVGLLGMQERVEAMGGTLTVASSPGRGTSVHARIPLSV